MNYLAAFMIWILAVTLQINVFQIEHDAYVMLYGAGTLAVMIVVLALMD